MQSAQRFFFSLLAMLATWGLHSQSDTLNLANGRVLVGSYKVSFTAREVAGRTNDKEIYQAKDVKSLSTARKRYRAVDVFSQGETSQYMADRRLDSEVDLYAVDFPSGYFNVNSVAQSFFYFEKGGVLTYVNKGNLEGFYKTYFGDCYGWMPNKTLLYNESSIVKMLNAYNKCLNPSAPQQDLAPTLSGLDITAYGGIAKLSHYPLNVAFNNGRFEDNASFAGLGINFLIKQNVKIGLELSHTKHSVASPIFLANFVSYSPLFLSYGFSTFGVNISSAYILRFNKLTLSPGASAGFSKLYGYTESQGQPNIYINYQPYPIDPNAADVFEYEQLFYNLRAYADLGYDLGSRTTLFARAGFNLTVTKSLAASKEGNHAIDGLLLALGIAYKIKN